MVKRNICVVITARPSYSRIKSALLAINEHPQLNLQLVLAGSALLERYGNASRIIEKDGFKVVEKVFNVIEGDSSAIMAKTTGLAIIELSSVFEKIKPDLVITIADRFETIATSIAASYQNIPLVHIQGGEVTGNIDEKVRHANTKLADLHLVSNQDALTRVLKLGENKIKVINTGCPSIDLAKEVLQDPKFDKLFFKRNKGVGYDLKLNDKYLVVMQHPLTTDKENSFENTTTLLNIINKINIPTIWFWPNVDSGSEGVSKALRVFREKNKDLTIKFLKNMEPKDFLKLLINSTCLIGNSSVGIRECSFLGVPVVNIGERQNSRLRGQNVIDVAFKKEEIKNAIEKQIKNGRFQSSNIYGDGDSGKKIANELLNFNLSYHKTITY